MAMPEDQMAQMFAQAQGGQPPMEEGQEGQPEDAGVAPYPDAVPLDSEEGQAMQLQNELQQRQQEIERNHAMNSLVSIEYSLAAVNFYLYETATRKDLAVDVQSKAITSVLDSLTKFMQAQNQPQGVDPELQGEMEMAKHEQELEFNGHKHQQEIQHKEDLHNMKLESERMRLQDSQIQSQLNLQQKQQDMEMKQVNNQQSMTHKEQQHQKALKESKTDSPKASSKSTKSESRNK